MAGLFGVGDFTKEGKGVYKDEPQKRGFFRFIEQFFEKIGGMCKLNMLYAIAALPTFIIAAFLLGIITNNIINSSIPTDIDEQSIALLDTVLRFFVSLMFMILWGMGPVTAGFTYVLRNYARREHAWIWNDFWKHTKANFKQGAIVFIIDVFAAIAMTVAYVFYSHQTSIIFYMKYVILWTAVIYTMMHFYMYPIMVTFKTKLKDIYKNSLILTFAKLPINLFILFVILLVNVGIPYLGVIGYGGLNPIIYWGAFLLLEFLILISFSGFVVNFNVNSILEKHMMPEEETENEVVEA